MAEPRLQRAFALFDAANSEDPRQQDGEPMELLYARRMTDWLGRLYPDASEPLRLAARAQHIQRWKIPRGGYPMTRAGYLQWRTELGRFHAQTAARILREVGYQPETIDRVGVLLRKEKLKADPDVQALEDVVCMVFLEHELADFSAKHDQDKVIRILRKTWNKMSPIGQAAARKLELSPAAAALIHKAISL